MEKKIKIIIAIIVLIVVLAGAVFAYTTLFNGPVTHFDNDFMSGDFVGSNVVLNETASNDTFTKVYNDPKGIQYVLKTADCFNYTMGIYLAQGIKNPEIRNFNGVDWEIYYAAGVNNATNTTVNMYMCTATVNNQSYFISVISNNDTGIKCDGTTYCDLYKNYVSPLLSSVVLKQTADVPTEYELLGISQSEYTSALSQIAELLASS